MHSVTEVLRLYHSKNAQAWSRKCVQLVGNQETKTHFSGHFDSNIEFHRDLSVSGMFCTAP